MDFIWHGMSSRPPSAMALQGDVHWLRQFTLQVLDLMAALGLESASFEGESWVVGWHSIWPLTFPEKVDAIVLNTAWGIALDEKWVKEGAADLTRCRKPPLRRSKTPRWRRCGPALSG
ncbi:MAG: hypothetical protein CM15mP74_09220 [Halieaceae bacterium]|nr:MAG: hypothetical protein CM15mP74_09220 [Halieaceae bacterium]